MRKLSGAFILLMGVWLIGCTNANGIDEFAKNYFEKMEARDWKGMQAMVNAKAMPYTYDQFAQVNEKLFQQFGNIKEIKIIGYKTEFFLSKARKDITYGLQFEKGSAHYQIVIEKTRNKLAIVEFHCRLKEPIA